MTETNAERKQARRLSETERQEVWNFIRPFVQSRVKRKKIAVYVKENRNLNIRPHIQNAMNSNLINQQIKIMRERGELDSVRESRTHTKHHSRISFAQKAKELSPVNFNWNADKPALLAVLKNEKMSAEKRIRILIACLED